MKLFWLTCYLLAFVCSAHAQSTSTWIKAKPDSASPQGSLGSSYISINLVAASVYQDSNWWTSLIEKNRSAAATAEISGSLSGGKALSDKRISPAIAIQKNKKNVDFGWSQTLVRDMPVNFTSMGITVEIAKTAADGVDQLIAGATDISKKVPALSASDAALGAVSAAKLVVDFIFDKQLAASKLKSANPLTAPAGTTLAPGFYVVLAGQSADEYQKYMALAADGTSNLTWENGILKYASQPIQGLTYFVIEVAYKQRLYDEAMLPDAALTSEKDWAKLYRDAISQAKQISDLKIFGDKVREIGITKGNAEKLLNDDPSFVQAERGAIQSKVVESLNRIINDRRTLLLAAEKSGTTPLFSHIEKLQIQ